MTCKQMKIIHIQATLICDDVADQDQIATILETQEGQRIIADAMSRTVAPIVKFASLRIEIDDVAIKEIDA